MVVSRCIYNKIARKVKYTEYRNERNNIKIQLKKSNSDTDNKFKSKRQKKTIKKLRKCKINRKLLNQQHQRKTFCLRISFFFFVEV